MQLLNLLCRIVVGCLFIFSGLIKLNDPYGTAYKLEEYFHVFSADFSPFFQNFIPYSLFFSIAICAFEVILGAAILIGYRMKTTMWITVLLMLFFTFLTFYSYAFDKVKECGCFGTAIKLSAGQSFYKDLFLLAIIIILFIKRKTIQSSFNGIKGHVAMAAIAILSVTAGVYSKNHLPYIDLTPYKTGNELTTLTKPKASPEYLYVFEKNGKEYEFDAKHYPSDPSYKYKRFILLTDSSLLIPEIIGFRIYNDEGDFTEEALKGKKIFIIIADPAKALEHCNANCMVRINKLKESLESRGFKSMILTLPSSGNSFEDYRHEVQLSGDYYFIDDSILKSMIRSNPGVMLLENGKILSKWHYNDIPEDTRNLFE